MDPPKWRCPFGVKPQGRNEKEKHTCSNKLDPFHSDSHCTKGDDPMLCPDALQSRIPRSRSLLERCPTVKRNRMEQSQALLLRLERKPFASGLDGKTGLGGARDLHVIARVRPLGLLSKRLDPHLF